MRKTMVDVTTGDGVADAYLVEPDDAGEHPAVLYFMDGFGPRPRMFEMADRVAERGFTVLLPNLFYRAGRAPLVDLAGIDDPERRGQIFAQIMPMARALTPDAIARDAGAYLDFLTARDGVQAGPAAIVGYCLGGTNALRVAAAHPDRIAAFAGFHSGNLVSDAPDSPHLGVAAITGEVYLGHADQDPSSTAEQIAVLEAALQAAGVRYTSEIYPGARHGFTMADTATYSEAAEQRHWTRLFELLERTF